MLGTLSAEKKCCWSQHFEYFVHADNSTKNNVTRYSPYRLMFGREARLPVDIYFGTSPGKDSVFHSQHVAKLKKDLEEVYQLATVMAEETHERNKRLYDKRVVHQVLGTGVRVLLKNVGLQDKHKLQEHWSSMPYVVERKLPFHVEPENGRGKILHRDNLLPIGKLVSLPLAGKNDDTPPVPLP